MKKKSKKTSTTLKRIAADANVILSAVIGGAAARVFASPALEILTTAFNIEEVKEYIPRMTKKYGLPQDIIESQLKFLPLTVKNEKFYKKYISRSENHMKNIDPDDIHLYALALKEKIPVWSNDRHFKSFKYGQFTTARLLKTLTL